MEIEVSDISQVGVTTFGKMFGAHANSVASSNGAVMTTAFHISRLNG
jgi:hypothetical protein